MKKKNITTFLRTAYISSIVTLCIIFAVYGVFEAYKNIRRIGFGEYRNALELENGRLEILDFSWEIVKGNNK